LWFAKISGVTNFDAALSIDVSSEFAIGVIVDDISDVRSISKFDARRIFANIEHCVKIAQVAPSSLDEIFDMFETCQPNMIQINGDFFNDMNNLISLQSIATVPIIGSIFLDKETLESNIINPSPLSAAQEIAPFVSVVNINLPLGSSWSSQKKKAEVVDLVTSIKNSIDKPLIIGGGLNSSNVGKIISELTPNAIDISSGVEKVSGIKDPALMQDFLDTVFDYKTFLLGVWAPQK
jgi:phosphoribosylanthranilate isomerase